MYLMLNDKNNFSFEICVIVFFTGQLCEGHDTHSDMLNIYSNQIPYYKYALAIAAVKFQGIAPCFI